MRKLIMALAIAAVATAVVGVAPALAAHRHLAARASVHTTKVYRNGTFLQVGRVRSTLGNGRLYVRGRIRGRRIYATFTAYLPRGAIRGYGAATRRGSRLSFRGTAVVKGGTRAYRHARGSRLLLGATASSRLTSGTFALSGTIAY